MEEAFLNLLFQTPHVEARSCNHIPIRNTDPSYLLALFPHVFSEEFAP